MLFFLKVSSALQKTTQELVYLLTKKEDIYELPDASLLLFCYEYLSGRKHGLDIPTFF